MARLAVIVMCPSERAPPSTMRLFPASATKRSAEHKTESLRFAENLNAHVVRASGTKLIEGIREFIREYHITQVIFGRSARAGWRWLLYLSSIDTLLRDFPTVDVHIVTLEPHR